MHLFACRAKEGARGRKQRRWPLLHGMVIHSVKSASFCSFFYTAGLAEEANDGSTEGTWFVPSDAALKSRIAVGEEVPAALPN